MHDFLTGEAGGLWREDEIVIFPNGVHELMLESALNNAFDIAMDSDAPEDTTSGENMILLYICTESPVKDGEETFWLGGQELRRDVIAYYVDLAKKCGVEIQVVWDSDCEMESEKDLGWEKVPVEKIGVLLR